MKISGMTASRMLKRSNALFALFAFALGLGQQATMVANASALGAIVQGAATVGALKGVANGLNGVNYVGNAPLLGAPLVTSPLVSVPTQVGVGLGQAGLGAGLGLTNSLGLGLNGPLLGTAGVGLGTGLNVGLGLNSITNTLGGIGNAVSNSAQALTGGLTNVAEQAIGGWVNQAANVAGALTGGLTGGYATVPAAVVAPAVVGGVGGGSSSSSSSSSSAGGASSSSSSAGGGRGGLLGGSGGASSSSSSAAGGGGASSSSSAAGASGPQMMGGYGGFGPYGGYPYGGGYGMVGSPAAAAASSAAAAGGAAAAVGAAGGAAAAGLAAAEGLGGGLGMAGASGLAAMTMPLAAGPMGPPVGVGTALAAGAAGAAAAAGAASATGVAASPMEAAAMMEPGLMGRAAMAGEAYGQAEAEAAIAGENMMEHGLNNARSAALASNAYRQAKLASARDRVNIAGTIQNTARISDAAIATHDAATKAEDSLLGSEVAVDSAGTVLDSDAAYIPPVTNSLLRSLPYGRLSLRNIVPRPLTYPSHLLPDVWLNGAPVNYMTLPLRTNLLPSPLGGALGVAGAAGAAAAAATGAYGPLGLTSNGAQLFYSNNGVLSNDLVLDPQSAYYLNPLAGLYGVSSVLPILANGQLQALDEVEASHLTSLQQQVAAGAATYNGFGSFNLVPMLTGTVSDANLIPTTIMGTTYPIGSAFVIEPRDSYFQDYIDSSSSRQNFDERTQ